MSDNLTDEQAAAWLFERHEREIRTLSGEIDESDLDDDDLDNLAE